MSKHLAAIAADPAPGEPAILILSRKKNESIIINDDITIVVVEIRGDKVRLGVEAPKEVPVHHNEVYQAIRGNISKDDRVRQRIADLKRQIHELEAELTAP